MNTPSAAFHQIPESELPSELAGRTAGDRVRVTRDGLLHVRGGRASFVPWSALFGVCELDDCLYVLTDRPLPAAPWYMVSPDMVRGGAVALPALAERLRRGRPQGGYRGAVRHHRARLSLEELVQRVRDWTPLPGSLTVAGANLWRRRRPPRVLYPLLALMVSVPVAMQRWLPANTDLRVLLYCTVSLSLPLLGVVLILGLIRLGHLWGSRHGVRRVLVLAPDGCVVGLPQGVFAQLWHDIAGFRCEQRGGEAVLVVHHADGSTGVVHQRYLDAPARLIAAVANTYRQAAVG